MNQAPPSAANWLVTMLKALFRDLRFPPLSIVSLVLAVLMLFAGVLLLVDAQRSGR